MQPIYKFDYFPITDEFRKKFTRLIESYFIHVHKYFTPWAFKMMEKSLGESNDIYDFLANFKLLLRSVKKDIDEMLIRIQTMENGRYFDGRTIYQIKKAIIKSGKNVDVINKDGKSITLPETFVDNAFMEIECNEKDVLLETVNGFQFLIEKDFIEKIEMEEIDDIHKNK